LNIRLVYFSRALGNMSLQDIQNILDTARGNNAELDVCGMLCFEANWFLQALEGERQVVNELFLEIADDPRHDDIEILSFEYIDECVFPAWHMGYTANSGEVTRILQSFGQTSFQPDQLQPEQALEFLTRMSQLQVDAAA